MTVLTLSSGSECLRAHSGSAVDISIPLYFEGPQPNHFAGPAATAAPLEADGFVGDTRAGGSCNAEALTLVPHCNGTHTECIGHVTDERVAVRDVLHEALLAARLISVTPQVAADCAEPSAHARGANDLLISKAVLQQALQEDTANPALVVRTLPNSPEKCLRHYRGASPAPYFTPAATEWLAAIGVRHLLVDLPSLDRAQDDGQLAAHRAFWGLETSSRERAQALHPAATITEMIFVPDDAADGLYLLSLQIAPFMSDAAPSRPLLFSAEVA